MTLSMIDELMIHWADGIKETHRNLSVDGLIRLTHTPPYPRERIILLGSRGWNSTWKGLLIHALATSTS